MGSELEQAQDSQDPGRKVEVRFKVNTRPFRKALDEMVAAEGFIEPEEADARALGRTLEEIDELETR